MLYAGKSGSNLLDRLRVSKGFPAGNDVDLEHFLNPNTDQKVNNNKPVYTEEEEEIQVIKEKKKKKFVKDKEKENMFDLMSSVLSELFIMGNNHNKSGIKNHDIASKKTKGGRKQRNPKPCVISYGGSDDPVMSDDGSDKEGEKKKLGFDLEKNGYSRADVMIIDTSASIWKSEKWVFRKGHVWKVRDKKSKCRNVCGMRKKRKRNSKLSDNENIDKKMKRERLLRISQSPSSSGGVQ